MGLLPRLVGIVHLLLDVMELDLVAAWLGSIKVSCFHLRLLPSRIPNAGPRSSKLLLFCREPVYSSVKEILALIR